VAKKKDPSITFLNNWGYNVVKLPRAGIEPLDVIGKDQATQWLGPLNVIWTSKSPVPVPGPPRPAAIVNGQKTASLDASMGLNVLANALAAFGATVPSLDTAYQSAKQVQFAYSGVTLSMISPLDAGNYLAGGDLRTDNPTVKNYFENPKCATYLITSVLKSASITVTATDQHGATVGVDVPAISGLVGANVQVKPSSASNSTVTFTGPEPVSFGFVAQQIAFAGGVWSLRDAPASGDIAFGAGHEEPGSAPGSRSKGVIFEEEDGDCRIDLHYSVAATAMH
jgi:hypothetical protein